MTTAEEELQQINRGICEVRDIYLDIWEFRYKQLSDKGITTNDSIIRHHLITIYESLTKLGIINNSLINNLKIKQL